MRQYAPAQQLLCIHRKRIKTGNSRLEEMNLPGFTRNLLQVIRA